LALGPHVIDSGEVFFYLGASREQQEAAAGCVPGRVDARAGRRAGFHDEALEHECKELPAEISGRQGGTHAGALAIGAAPCVPWTGTWPRSAQGGDARLLLREEGAGGAAPWLAECARRGMRVGEWRGEEGRGRWTAIYGGEAPEHGCHMSPLQQFIEHVVSATVATLGGHFWHFLLGFGHGSL
jgi:hypothetical protein